MKRRAIKRETASEEKPKPCKDFVTVFTKTKRVIGGQVYVITDGPCVYSMVLAKLAAGN